ncbi:MAG: hypothetical protein JO055_01930 [Alphaproteobacteria bacterium]|nr:hypothetical protein [Alphaproteobacteria bacterium]
MPDPKRPNPTPVERPSNPDPERERHQDEPAPRLIHPEDEDRKVRTDKGEKRPFGVMP